MEENNKIIAEFMGFTFEKNIGYYDNEMLLEQIVYEQQNGNCFDELLFNKDWNWLMAVVEKIENLPSRTLQGTYYLGNEVKIYKAINTNTHYCEINLVKESGYRIVSIQFNKESKIKSVYDACLEFIKWYNEQNKV